MAEQMMQHIADELAVKQAIPAGYKQTEVGIIPNDWGVKCLGELVEISSGESPSKFTFNLSGIPYFKVEQLNNGLVYAESTPYFIDSRKKITSGSLIFPKRGASILLNKIRVLKYDSYMDTNLMTLTCSSELNEFYLYNQLIYKELSSVADTTSIPQINNKHIVPYTIPYPAKAEQIAIATVLSDSDALIVGLEQLIAKKQAIKTAAMQQLLTGRTRLPQFALRSDGTPKGYKTSELGQIPEDWEIMPLVSIGRTIRGVSYNPNNDLYISDSSDSIRLFRSNNILNSRLVFSGLQYVSKNRVSESQKMQLGDILICMANGSKSLVGKSAIHDLNDGYEYTFGAFMGVFRLNDASQSKYVYYLMNSVRYRCYIDLILAGSSINNLKPSDIDKLSLAFPDIEEQTAIAAMLSDMDSELAALEQKLAKARDVKQGMMQQLLTGRIRLPLPQEA
ncbi:restriction endonuclease subunit S [Aeromonas dhakensis]|uniref:restriction endonuclease subunit S n=1 Tax=Aeromonas dhakensis TaxID=196024 RepID=UPI00227B4017|nr:restriction endonuclease subunit S [Aeromonas dhakensis]WAF70162.1 restriction endonuclease subunit S [Aeromonas dhakensis]